MYPFKCIIQWILVNLHNYANITMIQIENISITQRSEVFTFSQSISTPWPRASLIFISIFLYMFAFTDVSCKWSHTIHDLLCLPFPTYRSVPGVYPFWKHRFINLNLPLQQSFWQVLVQTAIPPTNSFVGVCHIVWYISSVTKINKYQVLLRWKENFLHDLKNLTARCENKYNDKNESDGDR